MPTFFDPISGEDVDVKKARVFYLVKSHDNEEKPENNTYCIRGLCTNPNRLAKDPILNRTIYWYIDQKKILENEHHGQLFPDDRLIETPLNLEQVKLLFDCNPNDMPYQSFNKQVGDDLNQRWVNNIARASSPQGVLTITYASATQIAELIDLSQGLFTAEAFENFVAYPVERLIDFLKNTTLLPELTRHGFTPDRLICLAFDHENMSALFSEERLKALEREIMTADSFPEIRPSPMGP